MNIFVVEEEIVFTHSLIILTKLYRILLIFLDRKINNIKKKREHRAETICYLCSEKFNWNVRSFYRVSDHCHYTRKYQSATHSVCNLKYKENRYIPKIAENASRLLKIVEKQLQKTIFFLCWWKHWKVYLFLIRKKFEKENSIMKIITKVIC